MKYIVWYVEDCSLKWREFKTKKETVTWLDRFITRQLRHPSDGNWVSAVINGRFVFTEKGGWLK